MTWICGKSFTTNVGEDIFIIIIILSEKGKSDYRTADQFLVGTKPCPGQLLKN